MSRTRSRVDRVAVPGLMRRWLYAADGHKPETNGDRIMNMNEFIEKHGIKCAVVGDAKKPWDKRDEWQQSANGFRVRMTAHGRRMELDFFMGNAITGVPQAEDVLDCLQSDSSVMGMDFEEWCGDLGYDPDSRKAEKMYRETDRQARRVFRFMGREMFDEFQEVEA